MEKLCENCAYFRKKVFKETNPFKDMIGICMYKTNQHKTKKEKLVVKLSICNHYYPTLDSAREEWEKLLETIKKVKEEFAKNNMLT